MSVASRTPFILLALALVVSGGCGPQVTRQVDGAVSGDGAITPDGRLEPDAAPLHECVEMSDCAQFEDGDLCNGTLVCEGSFCTVDPATVVTCDPSQDTECLANHCDPGTGACGMLEAADGTPCNDGDLCTENDTCGAGHCGGATEVCCSDGQDNDGDGVSDCDDADCAGLPECTGGCPSVPVPDPVPDAPLPGESPAGLFESTWWAGFFDHYVYNQAGTIKIGVREQWGGTIIFFGMSNGLPGMNNTNVIDANDTGREVQVAFYDPDRHMQNCAWNASCQSTPTTCPFSITYLGWNPVQGGNRCNNGSGVESVDEVDGAITVTTTPLFWNPNWDRQDCDDNCCSDPVLSVRQSDVRVIQRVRFVREHVVELDYTLINLGSLDHASTAQELPTVYTGNGNQGPDLWRLFNSGGQEIAIDTPGNDGFFYESFSSTGGWVTMQNDSLDYGVGLSTENRLVNWQGWQLRSLPFNNFRPLFAFGIPASGTIRARSYLILGSLATVSSEAQWLDANLAPFGSLDGPAEDETVSGQVSVHGWALDNKGVTSVELVIDGVTTVPLSYGASRPDVCAVWPEYPGCSQVGFVGTFDTAGLSPCPHLLEARAHDADGNSRVIDRHRIFVAP